MLKSKHSNKFKAQMDLSWGMWATLIQATKGEDKKKQMMENLPASLYNYFEPAIPTSNLITETFDTRRKENSAAIAVISAVENMLNFQSKELEKAKNILDSYKAILNAQLVETNEIAEEFGSRVGNQDDIDH